MALLDDLIGALPAGSRFRLDANGAWDRRTAERWLDCASGRPVEFVEQPVAQDSRGADDCLLGLAADYPTPIALDESIADEEDVGRWMDLGLAGVFRRQAGPAWETIREVLGRLAKAHARVVFSSALETGIGAQAALRLAFAWPGKAMSLGFGVWPLFSDSRFDGPCRSPVPAGRGHQQDQSGGPMERGELAGLLGAASGRRPMGRRPVVEEARAWAVHGSVCRAVSRARQRLPRESSLALERAGRPRRLAGRGCRAGSAAGS